MTGLIAELIDTKKTLRRYTLLGNEWFPVAESVNSITNTGTQQIVKPNTMANRVLVMFTSSTLILELWAVTESMD